MLSPWLREWYTFGPEIENKITSQKFILAKSCWFYQFWGVFRKSQTQSWHNLPKVQSNDVVQPTTLVHKCAISVGNTFSALRSEALNVPWKKVKKLTNILRLSCLSNEVASCVFWESALIHNTASIWANRRSQRGQRFSQWHYVYSSTLGSLPFQRKLFTKLKIFACIPKIS